METPDEIASFLAMTAENKKIILFDGVCNLCNSAVQFIIERDKKDVFRFVTLQSDFGKEICSYIGIDPKMTDSIILYEPGIAYYYKSQAAFKIASQLGSFYSLLAVFKVLPRKTCDSIYDYIAKNRYSWYGKKEHCMIPSPELKAKFI
ncbi:thiol-disulfide oxidoreductase DCC family protein [Flavobacterium commune]|nr:DCC1-like thiol-disulfide oxidoreductase family protein [Flavobacterium commune]